MTGLQDDRMLEADSHMTLSRISLTMEGGWPFLAKHWQMAASARETAPRGRTGEWREATAGLLGSGLGLDVRYLPISLQIWFHCTVCTAMVQNVNKVSMGPLCLAWQEIKLNSKIRKFSVTTTNNFPLVWPSCLGLTRRLCWVADKQPTWKFSFFLLPGKTKLALVILVVYSPKRLS